MTHTAQLEKWRTPGYGDLWKVRCNCCGWESQAIDPVLNNAKWRRAQLHRCNDEA